jgi:hypothetical protein
MINIDNIVALASTVEVADETDGYTGYGIARIINKTLKVLGADVEVLPQMVYNDATTGKINGVKAGPHNRIRYNDDEVTNYVARFVAKYSKAVNTENTESFEDTDEADEDLDDELIDDAELARTDEIDEQE